MLKLATLLDNPGEPFARSRYRDPAELAALGYNGLVLYETTGLSGVDGPEVIGSDEMKRWVSQQFDLVRQRIEAGTKAGLGVYISYDALSLARDAVQASPGDLTCVRKASMLCPASEPTIERCVGALENLLRRLPEVSGVVLRMGDNDASRVPYLIGNDVYQPHCARCSALGRADRIALVLGHFHRLVVEKLGRRLIVRAWNVRPNGMHDTVDLCRRVVERLPGAEDDPRLVLSFKFTQTDFWRYQRWNPSSLCCGKRPILYELQCQREFEGKGSVPNWQAPVWRDGCPEVGGGGLAEASGKVNLAGLWAWVRGGGWGGPFVNNETWIDANVYAVPRLAENPQASAGDLAKSWVRERLGIQDTELGLMVERILTQSPEAIRQGFYIGPYAQSKKDGWHPNADWIQDDLVNAQAAWRIIQRLNEGLLDEVVQEKQSAVDQVFAQEAALQKLVTDSNRRAVDPLISTLVYEQSLFAALRDLLAGLVAYRRWQKGKTAASADACRQRVFAAQSHWTHHTQRHGSLPGAATTFREVHFWELTQRILEDLGRGDGK